MPLENSYYRYLFAKCCQVHPSWTDCLTQAFAKMNPDYLDALKLDALEDESLPAWLPGPRCLLNAFSIPVNQVNYVLLGESPYPRVASANGYAFWDAAVHGLWSPTGLDKIVNRATSLRHLIKMLLIAENLLHPAHATQNDIAKLDKNHLVQNGTELFQLFLQKGFLLLNASLVLRINSLNSPNSPSSLKYDAIAWQPFLIQVLEFLLINHPQIKIILLGKIAQKIEKMIPLSSQQKIIAEHPYNISFIHNPVILNFFRPLHCLIKS